jgi:hypothetical protein
MKRLRLSYPLIISLALVVPVSPNYALQELDFGAGGGTGQTSNYRFEGVMGEHGTPLSGTAYNGGLGFGFTQMANVPNAPQLTNPNNYYNKLHLVIDPSGNPNDTLFALAISSDNFATTQYIKPDRAVASTLSFTDYQTYAAWGGGAGFDILGLQASTAYQVKVKAFHGDFTESGFGPSATATTANATLSFDIDVAATDTSTAPPYLLHLGTLLAGTVTTSPNKIWVSLDTNAEAGATIFIASQNGGLSSQRAAYDIDSASGDLNSLGEGYGLQATSAQQQSGGPLIAVAPYNASTNTVGALTTTYQKLLSTASPITNGRGSAVLKARPATSAPAQTDYTDIITLIGAANFANSN